MVQIPAMQALTRTDTFGCHLMASALRYTLDMTEDEVRDALHPKTPCGACRKCDLRPMSCRLALHPHGGVAQKIA